MELSISQQERLHSYSSRHRKEILAAKSVDCFYCRKILSPIEIVEWIDGNETARCPACGVDSVIPMNFTPDIAEEVLLKMKEYWI
jgi:hypothetical protein